MDMSGEYRIPAPRQRVWEALNDPEVLKASIPGCETLEKVSDTELMAKVKAKVGPVSATFGGKVSLSDLNPPTSYKISGEGSGGVAGFAKGGADVRLAEDGAQATVLTYNAKADVGGKLAQIGSRLVQGSAKKMADDFFGRFSRIVGGEEVGPAPLAGTGAGQSAPNGAAGAASIAPGAEPDAGTGLAERGAPSADRGAALAPATSVGAADHSAAAASGGAAEATQRRVEAQASGAGAGGGPLRSPLTWVGVAAAVVVLYLLLA